MEDLICIFMYIGFNILVSYIIKITILKKIPDIS